MPTRLFPLFALALCYLAQTTCAQNAQPKTPAEKAVEPLVEALQKGDHDAVLAQSEPLLAAAQAQHDTFLLVLTHYNRGRAYLYQKDMAAVLAELGRADSLGRKSDSVPVWLRGEVASYLGYAVLYGKSDLEGAHALMTEGMALKQSVAKERPSDLGISYYHLGVFYQAAGDFRQSIAFGRKGIAVFERDSNQYLSNLAACNNLVGNGLSELNKPDALSYLFRAQAQFKRLFGKEVNANSASVWYTIGKAYFLGKKFNAGKDAFEKAIAHFSEIYKTTARPFVASAKAYLGVCYFGLKDYKKAHELAEEGISIWHLCQLGPQPDLAAFQFESAKALTALGRLDEAQARIDSSLLILGYKNQTADVTQDFLNLTGTFDALVGLTEVHQKRFQKSGKTADLEAAVSHARSAASVFFVVRDSLIDDSSIQAFTDRSYENIETLLHVFWMADSMRLGEKNHFSEAFQLAERLRGFVLLKTWFRSRNDGKRPAFETQSLSLQQVQAQLLRPDQVLLEYFVGEHSIYLFIVKKDTVFVRRIPRDFPLEQRVDQLREGITAYHRMEMGTPKRTPAFKQKCDALYLRTASDLYRRLFAPAEALIASGTELVIVTDGVLGFVPFEALLTRETAPSNAETNFAALPYLLRQYKVRYGWSASTLWEMSKPLPPCIPCAKALEFIGFAPFVKTTYGIGGKQFDLLTYFGDAQNDLIKIFQQSGGGYSGSAAQKSTFFKEAPCARYLYLGTHALADNGLADNSYIAFAPKSNKNDADLLFLPQVLDSLRLCRTELVMLSACETGLGPNSRGEGIISLGRAFALSGAKSIAYTLWTVREAASRQMSTQFFRAIRQNKKSKTEALALAKLSLIANQEENWAHPFFWAGFVLAGDGGL